MSLSENDVINLKVGSHLPLNAAPDQPITLLCGDMPMFTGKMGRKGNFVAVCIEEKVEPEQTEI